MTPKKKLRCNNHYPAPKNMESKLKWKIKNGWESEKSDPFQIH